MHSEGWIAPTMEEAALLPGLAEGGIHLRPYDDGDTDALFEAAVSSQREIGQWLPWCRPGYSRTDAASFVEKRSDAWAAGADYAFAILDETSGRLLGGCGLNEIRPAHRCANLGYWVRTDATRRGVASTASRLVAKFGIVHLGLLRIEIVAAVGNIASQRAAHKSGAKLEGILRNRLHLHGMSHDAYLFSFTPRDLGVAEPGAMADPG